MKIFDKIRKAYKKELPFVAYSKPNETKVSAFLQKDDSLHKVKDFSEKGFVFAPFDDSISSILIPKSDSKFYTDAIGDLSDIDNDTSIDNDMSSKEEHINLIEKGIKAIQNDRFKKVVLSRKETIEIEDIDIFYSFLMLLKTYTNAFVYIWFHPKVGLWMGATPETLIKIKGSSFETMSLAGTQKYNGTTNVEWDSKEVYEQKLVTDYVLEKLIPICSLVTAESVNTIQAGDLLHLKTQISGDFSGTPKDLISVLHPTPAVCGFPKEVAKEFILENENYNREFYTGFLGEMNLPNSELFVNLRCVQVINDSMQIYVGGGITKDSNPQKEWEETIAKTQTIKKVL